MDNRKAISVLSAFLLLLSVRRAVCEEVKIGGYGQVQFADGSAPGNHLACKMKRLRLTVTSEITDKIGYYSQFDMLSVSSPLLDFIIDYDLGVFGKLGAGRFRRPFGLQHTFSTFDLNTVNYSRVVSEIVGSGSRDYGIRLRGRHGSANWILGLVNGAYPSTHVTLTGDDDDVKDLVGRAGIGLLDGLEIGTSGYFSRSSGVHVQKIKAGADLRYDRGGVLVQAEAIYGKDGRRLERAGVYIETGYSLKKFQPILRYEIFDADTRGPTTNEETILAAGLNYYASRNAIVRFIFEEHVDNLGSDGSDRDDDNICILQVGARI